MINNKSMLLLLLEIHISAVSEVFESICKRDYKYDGQRIHNKSYNCITGNKTSVTVFVYREECCVAKCG